MLTQMNIISKLVSYHLHMVYQYQQRVLMIQESNVAFLGFACSPNNKHILCAFDSTLIIVDFKQQETIGKNMNGHGSPIQAIGYSKDGLYIVSGSGDEQKSSCGNVDRSIRVWDAQRQLQVSKDLQGHTNTILQVGFLNDSSVVISGGVDNIIRIWNWKEGIQFQILQTNVLMRYRGYGMTTEIEINGIRHRLTGSYQVQNLFQAFDDPIKIVQYENRFLRFSIHISKILIFKESNLNFHIHIRDLRYFNVTYIPQNTILAINEWFMYRTHIWNITRRKLLRKLQVKTGTEFQFTSDGRYIIRRCDGLEVNRIFDD